MIRRRADEYYDNISCIMNEQRFHLHYADLSDSNAIAKLIFEIKPDEIYNLAAQSHVQVSFENPEYTTDIDANGALRILEAIRISGLEKNADYTRPPPRNYMAK